MNIEQIVEAVEAGKEEKNMSWRDITEKCGIPWQTVHNWQKRGASPKLDTVILLLGAVGKTLEIVNI